jgi:hypothetical protein
MKISKYNLIRFIIDVSLEDHKTLENVNWQKWFFSVSRVYNHKMPEQVVKAIASTGIPQLIELCDEEMPRIEKMKRSAVEKCTLEKTKYERWIQRRDAGNKRVLEEKRKRYEVDLQRVKEIEIEMNESYVQQMLPFWAQRLNEYVQQRDLELYTKPFNNQERN